MVKVILTIVVMLIFLGCAQKGTNDSASNVLTTKEIVEKIYGKKIQFPKEMVDCLTKDTLNFNNADYVILIYTDSAKCTSCSLKLPFWQAYINNISTAHHINVIPIIVINGVSRKNIIPLIRKYNYNFPVILDNNKYFNIINDIPKDSKYRTILLDSTLRVIAVGSPAYNSGISKLYDDIFTSRRESISNELDNVIKIDNPTYDVGTIESGKEINHVFRIYNTVEDTIFIRQIVNSCDCLSINVPRKYILPKETYPLIVKLKVEDNLGEFFRTVDIFFSNYEKLHLEIVGTII